MHYLLRFAVAGNGDGEVEVFGEPGDRAGGDGQAPVNPSARTWSWVVASTSSVSSAGEQGQAAALWSCDGVPLAAARSVLPHRGTRVGFLALAERSARGEEPPVVVLAPHHQQDDQAEEQPDAVDQRRILVRRGRERDERQIAGQFGPGAAAAVGGPAIGTYIEAPREHAAQLPVSLLPRLVPLAGREELLAELDARLSGDDSPEPRIVVLYGLGGAGKSSVAVEYAYRHLAEVGLAWQFAAADPAVLADEFRELATQLGVRDFFAKRNWVVTVHGMLAQYPARWLLVFDNAADAASVAEFLPPAGPGRVLVTSQDPAWQTGQAMEVPVLRPEVAADFLVQRTGDPDRQAAEDLAKELDGLPLALAQAAAYVQATGDRLAEYLESFRQRRADMLARGASIRHGKTVASTWALAFGRLQQDTPMAVGLLRLMAYCASEAIPLRLLLRPGPELAEQLGQDVAPLLTPLLADQLIGKDAIAALRRYSLVTQIGEGLWSVHRLVQAVTVDQMPADVADQWRQATAALVEAAIPGDTQPPKAWPVCALLLPHARTVLDLTASGMSRVALYLGRSGSYPAARDLFQLVADAYSEDDAYGAEHPDTLIARTQLARWTGEAGDAPGARDQLAALLPILERVLGTEHPDTLTARSYLAHNTGLAGDPAGARDQLAELLPVRERVSGPDHPDTLAARDNLARWTGEAGDAARARDQLAALLPVLERVLGTEHQDALTARRDVASWTGEAGDPAGARDQFAALLPVFERVLSAEHPDTLATRQAVASWTGEAGNATGARDLLAELLPLRIRVLGPEHPDTLITRHLFASWTGEAGDQAAARDQYAALLPVFVRVLGPHHPETLMGRANLADWTGETGDKAAARDQYAALLPVRERVSGPEHPDTLATRQALARWTEEAESGPGSV